MKNKQIIVHCTYSDTDQTLAELIKESFRLFLQKELFALEFSCKLNLLGNCFRFYNTSTLTATWESFISICIDTMKR